MPDTTPGAGANGPADAAGVGPAAERVEALLDQAVQVSMTEQRRATAALADLHRQIEAVADQVRLTATSEQVGELDVRVAALSGTLSAQTASLTSVGAAVRALASLPDALRSLQREVAGLHDRLAALSAERGQAEQRLVEALAPQVADAVLRRAAAVAPARPAVPGPAAAPVPAAAPAPAAAPVPAAPAPVAPAPIAPAPAAAPAEAVSAAGGAPIDDGAAGSRPDPPVQPRPEVRTRFATASNVFGTPSDGTDGGPRRRSWWRPGA